ncbi:MAG: RNA polymerase sigma factor RpoD/SigA [Treponema sp.]|jgi:RNA polymerase primary sigma factor|nr:RNA polymerase sigma factor RpoD/SigA [Treponema sp.]
MRTVNNKPDDNNFSIYLRDIRKIPLLSREEEEKAAIEAAAGNKAARDKLVNSNLRFVINIAKRYQGLGLSLEDLISEGNTGLLTAVDRFDVNKGCHFISYAVWWIRQAIMSALCEQSKTIRLPTNRAAELIKIEKARKLLRCQNSAEEEIREIAKLLDMDKEHVTDLLNISREMISLDNPVSKDKDAFLKDFIEDNQYAAPDTIAEQNFLKADIENVLETLNRHEADIIRCHYGLGQRAMSLKEIGARYSLSKERIRQIEEKAIFRLKNPKRRERLQAYVA